MHESESHQCQSCGARLVTSLPMRAYLAIGVGGGIFFFTAVWALATTGMLDLLPTSWQWGALLVLAVATYLVGSRLIRRAMSFELWQPSNVF